MKKSTTSLSAKLQSALLVPALGTVLAFTLAGCGATKPGSASFASVIIKGHSPQEIATVTAKVFAEDGWAGGSMKGHPMVFQKEGSRMTDLAYAGVADTYYGAKTVVRVKMQLVTLGEDSHRLQCQAFIVKDPGDPFFSQEQRLANVRSGHYQSLLNQVAKQLE